MTHPNTIAEAIEIISTGAEALRVCSTIEGDWGDEVTAQAEYIREMRVVRELREIEFETQAVDASGRAAVDALMYGVGFYKVLPDGSQEHIPVERVRIMPATAPQEPDFDADAMTRLRGIMSDLGISTPVSNEQLANDLFSQLGIVRRTIKELFGKPGASQAAPSDPTEKFIADVVAELRRARAKFPGDRIMTIALAEEFGELCKAMLDEPGESVWKEAVQTAVMAARVAIDGDSSVDEWRASRGLDDHRARTTQGASHG